MNVVVKECKKFRKKMTSIEGNITKHFIPDKSMIANNMNSIPDEVKPMRFCYADPPYPGCAKRHYSHDPSGIEAQEVDHQELIERLMQYDAWALSTSTPALREILMMCPADVRIGSWVKPFCSFKPNVRVAFAWEPVIFYNPRKKQSKRDFTIRDWMPVCITMRRGTHGAKPDQFCFWLFEMMGLTPDDKFFDLFPGSGAVTIAWQRWKAWKGWKKYEGTEYDIGLAVVNDVVIQDMRSRYIHV